MKEPKHLVVAFTKGGEEAVRLKISPNKRHSKNNTIVGWKIYYKGKVYGVIYM